jgi:hypothetical protein
MTMRDLYSIIQDRPESSKSWLNELITKGWSEHEKMNYKHKGKK